MTALYDVTVSTLIAGFIILTIVALNGVISDAAFETTTSVAVQEDISDVARIIEYDFYKIGYNADPAFLYADSEAVKFRSDIDRDGIADVIAYLLESPASEAVAYAQLFRSVNGSPRELIGTGIVEFKLQYFNALGTQLTGLSPTDSTKLASIRSMKIQIMLQSLISPDTVYGASYWERYISPKNL